MIGMILLVPATAFFSSDYGYVNSNDDVGVYGVIFFEIRQATLDILNLLPQVESAHYEISDNITITFIDFNDDFYYDDIAIVDLLFSGFIDLEKDVKNEYDLRFLAPRDFVYLRVFNEPQTVVRCGAVSNGTGYNMQCGVTP